MVRGRRRPSRCLDRDGSSGQSRLGRSGAPSSRTGAEHHPARRSGPSSAAFNRRPSTGRSPMTSKNDPLTTPAFTTRGSWPKPINVKSTVEKSPNAVIVDARFEVIDFRDRECEVFGPDALGALADIDQPIRVPIDERTEEHARTTLKIAALAPMPSARVTMTVSASPFGACERPERNFQVGDEAHSAPLAVGGDVCRSRC